MKTKNFFRRMNRGIALAVALAIGLTGYLIYENRTFDGEREEIRAMFESFMGEFTQLQILPEAYQEIGSVIPEAVIEQQVNAAKPLFEKHFTLKNTYGGDLRTYSLDRFKGTMVYNWRGGERVKNCKVEITKMKITKYGTNMARAEIELRVTAETTAGAGVIPLNQNGEYYQGGEYENYTFVAGTTLSPTQPPSTAPAATDPTVPPTDAIPTEPTEPSASLPAGETSPTEPAIPVETETQSIPATNLEEPEPTDSMGFHTWTVPASVTVEFMKVDGVWKIHDDLWFYKSYGGR